MNEGESSLWFALCRGNSGKRDASWSFAENSANGSRRWPWPRYLHPPNNPACFTMELYLDSLNDLNSQLKQLVDIIEDWKGSRTEIRSVPVHLHRLWDQVCHLKNFIDNQLQQNAIFDGNGFDLAGLIRIRQGQSAISSLIEAAQGSALESWLLAPSLSIIERLEKYSKDLRDCTASVEEVCRELIQ